MGRVCTCRSKQLIVDVLLNATHAERVLWRSSAAMLAEEGMGTSPREAATDTGLEACPLHSSRCPLRLRAASAPGSMPVFCSANGSVLALSGI